MDWIQFKIDVEAWTGLHRDALHIYGALLGHLLAALLLRRTLASPLPWLMVLLFELANEAWDMLFDGLVEQWEIDGARHDIWNTMLLPTLLLILTRFLPRLFAPAPLPGGDPATGQPALENE